MFDQYYDQSRRPVETYTCFEEITSEILKLLRTARNSVWICVAWISDRVYGETLRQLAARNVEVFIIYNNDDKNAEYAVPPSPGIQTYAVSARLGCAFMHNKFCIIDDEVLINGSFNWSQNSPLSFENIIVVKRDYHLIKQFKHEFLDLLIFYRYQDTHQIGKCPVCRSHLFNLGIIGSERGKYNESQIDVWSVCTKNNHVSHLQSQYPQFFAAQMELDDERECEEVDHSKEAMQESFNIERNKIKRIQNYFEESFQSQIHALGVVEMENFNEHHKFDEDPYYVISIGWRNMYYRKIIPTQLESGYGEVDKIIDEHTPL